MASIAQMTGTLLDSGCKHIIPVRVNLDFYLERCETGQDVLLRNKMKFSAHKGDLLLCVGSNMFEHASGSYEHNDAYPPIISTIVEKESELSAKKQLALALVYCLQHDHLEWGSGGLCDTVADHIAHTVVNNTAADGVTFEKLRDWLREMPDFRFMGFSLGLGYAHPNSGDNVVSSLIGGMMTVRNGDFPMRTGDRVQWYFYFEKGFFESDGKRIKADLDDHVHDMAHERRQWPNEITKSDNDPYRMSRYIHAMQQNAVYDVNHVMNKNKRIDYTIGKIGAASIKPYFEAYGLDEYPLDRIRVFAKAVSNARPYDNVDIIICTQCI
jgi:hypothetical protein